MDSATLDATAAAAAAAPEGANRRGAELLEAAAEAGPSSIAALAGTPLWLEALAELSTAQRAELGVRFKVYRDDMNGDPSWVAALEDRVPTEEHVAKTWGPGSYLVRPTGKRKGPGGGNLREIRFRIDGAPTTAGGAGASELWSLVRELIRGRVATDRGAAETATDALVQLAETGAAAAAANPPAPPAPPPGGMAGVMAMLQTPGVAELLANLAGMAKGFLTKGAPAALPPT